MSSVDQKTKLFYTEMGFNQAQIQRAFEQSKKTGMDILDALNMGSQPSQAQQSSILAKQFEPVNKPKSYVYKNNLSFLTPWKKIRQNDYEILFSRSNKHQQTSNKNELRQENYPVGLLNVSNCCYLNSLIQCYFLMDAFKAAILTAEPLPNLEEVLVNESKTKLKRIKSQYDMLTKLKHFFTTMALTSKKYLDPSQVLQNLVDSVGEKISYGEQKDLSEINILIIERLSEGLTYSKNHFQPPQSESLLDMNIDNQGSTLIHNEHRDKRPFNSMFNPRKGAIKQLFYGSRVEYYDNPELQKEPPIVSDFTGLIMNPRAGNLYKALDEEFNFEVQINGGLQKKTAFIRDQPEYLFIYINRTDFNKQDGQASKNQQKFTFDFTFYLDRYLEQYRKEHDESHERIKELLASKNKLKEQINYLQILFKKIDDCQRYAQELEGWADKLPREEEFQEEYDRLEEKLEEVQKELNHIESRKEQYHLMYIFVHRGDAVSGHYWGYGRNGEQWYRFDINTRQIIQEQIIIDLQKSSATPYALLYVKQSNLPSFDYKIHQDNSILKQNLPKTDFRASLNPTIVNEIISENVTLHQEIILRSNNQLRDKTFNEYISRFNGIKKVALRYDEERVKNRHLGHVSMCNNFSLFLWNKDEMELCKFTLFEQALFNASGNKHTVQRLMQELDLLHLVQKKFKKGLRGQLSLKFYSLLPSDIQKLESLYQEYQVNSFQVVWGSVVLNQAEFYQDQWSKEVSNHEGIAFEPSESIKNRVLGLLRLIKIRNSLIKDENFKKALKLLPEPLYISQMNNEITKLLLLSLITTGLKVEGLQQFTDLSDQIGAQIITVNAGNSYNGVKYSEEKGSPVEEAIIFIQKFNAMMDKKSPVKRSTIRSATKINEEKNTVSNSGFKNSILSSSPGKINTSNKKISNKEELIDYGLVTNISTVLVFQTKDSWRQEELDNIKINFELGAKILNFLKKLGPLPKIYKKVLKQEKPLSIAELRSEGAIVNQEEAILNLEEVLLGQKQPQKQEEQSLI